MLIAYGDYSQFWTYFAHIKTSKWGVNGNPAFILIIFIMYL